MGIRRIAAALAIGAALFLGSCGGGGGGGDNPAAAPPGNWGTMLWDQGKWN